MRRIYYAYALRVITAPGLLQGFLMFGAILALTYFVSLRNVLTNLLNIPMRDIGTFAYNAITNTEAWTLLLLGIFIYAAFAFRFKVTSTHSLHSYANS